MATSTLSQLAGAITALGLPTPHHTFLTPILIPPPGRALPPLAALAATAKHRLLSSDLTTPQILSTDTASFPPRLSNPTVVSRVLGADVFVQVLSVEDLSRSKWEQIEALEMVRKGEMTKGREVIRVIPAEEGEEPSSAGTQAPQSTPANAPLKYGGPFRVELQDVRGERVYGFELKRVEKIGYPGDMHIGCKMLLRKTCKVSRGMLMLEPGTVVVLGGKIEGLDRQWREGREKELREAVGDVRRGN